MNEAVLIALIPVVMAGLAAMYKIAREQGRADAYEEEAKRTIAQLQEQVRALQEREETP